MRVSASMKSCCQGQRAGRCSVQRRALRVRRPGSASRRRRRVRAARTVRSGRPSRPVQRSRLWASAAITVQAALAKKLPGGEVRERLVFEIADAQLDDGVLAVFGLDELERVGAVGEERVELPGRQQLALGGRACGRGGRSAVACQRRLGDLRLAGRRVVVQGLPGAFGDLLDRGADRGLQAHPDRVAPARPLEPREDLS